MNKLFVKIDTCFSSFYQIFRFGIVGLSAASVHFAVVVSLVQFALMLPLIANVFGWIVSFQVSYWGHRLWTFQHSTALHREAFPKLLLVQLLNFLSNELLFYIFLMLHLPYPIALFIVLTLFPIFTFFSNKYWVFR